MCVARGKVGAANPLRKCCTRPRHPTHSLAMKPINLRSRAASSNSTPISTRPEGHTFPQGGGVIVKTPDETELSPAHSCLLCAHLCSPFVWPPCIFAFNLMFRCPICSSLARSLTGCSQNTPELCRPECTPKTRPFARFPRGCHTKCWK